MELVPRPPDRARRRPTTPTPSTTRSRPPSRCDRGAADGPRRPDRHRHRVRGDLRGAVPRGRRPDVDLPARPAAARLGRHHRRRASPATPSRTSSASFAAVPRALRSKAPDPAATVDTVVALADRARREGLLALEDATRTIDDPFLRSGLQAAIDGTDPDDLRTILEDKIATKRTRDRVHSKYFADMGGYAPTIGIIGTVISLVHVLENLSEPAELGHSIAAAFVATLWGILSANVVWLPLGARIRRISDLECAQMEVTLEGLLAVQAGANPRLVGERLRSLLPEEPAAQVGQGRRMSASTARGGRLAARRRPRGGARQPRALAHQLLGHDHRAHGAVHRPVRDQPGGPGQVRRPARQPRGGLPGRDGQRRRCSTARRARSTARASSRTPTPAAGHRGHGRAPTRASACRAPARRRRQRDRRRSTPRCSRRPRRRPRTSRSCRPQIAANLAANGLDDTVRFRIDERGLVLGLVADDVFFAAASAEMTDTARRVLDVAGPSLVGIGEHISVEGHANVHPGLRALRHQLGALRRPCDPGAAAPGRGRRHARRPDHGRRLR